MWLFNEIDFTILCFCVNVAFFYFSTNINLTECDVGLWTIEEKNITNREYKFFKKKSLLHNRNKSYNPWYRRARQPQIPSLVESRSLRTYVALNKISKPISPSLVTWHFKTIGICLTFIRTRFNIRWVSDGQIRKDITNSIPSKVKYSHFSSTPLLFDSSWPFSFSNPFYNVSDVYSRQCRVEIFLETVL